MNQPVQTPDPFAAGSNNPSLSFKGAAIGTSFTGVVTEAPTVQRARDYETGDPSSWPDGRDQMVATCGLMVDGEARTVWAVVGMALHSAISAGSSAQGKRIEVGGTLTITFTGEKPNKKNPRLNPAKQYSAVYEPPVAGAPLQAVVPVPYTETTPDAPPW